MFYFVYKFNKKPKKKLLLTETQNFKIEFFNFTFYEINTLINNSK